MHFGLDLPLGSFSTYFVAQEIQRDSKSGSSSKFTNFSFYCKNNHAFRLEKHFPFWLFKGQNDLRESQKIFKSRLVMKMHM